ncbi:hypothetical protein [Brevibacterium picturae]
MTPREHEVALTMVRHAHTSPDEEDRAAFTREQEEAWDPPALVTQQQRVTWESNLAEVVVTNP